MKKGLVFWIEDNVDIVRFTGVLFLEESGKNTGGAEGAQCFNLRAEDIKNANELYCPRKGKAEKVQEGVVSGDQT